MAYVPAYPTRINWENEPSDATALNDVNLNKMDYAIYQHDQALQAFDGRISTLEGASYVNSFNGRAGAVTPAQDDYTIDQIKATGTAGQYVALDSNGKLTMVTLPAYPTAGHVVVNPSGSIMTQRSKIKFMGSVSVTDDSTNDQTVVNITGGGGGTGGHTILDPSGSSMTQRTNLQFTGTGVSVSDNAGDDKTVVTINGGGSSGHTIKDGSGTAMTAQPNLQFVDAKVTNDGTNNATVIHNFVDIDWDDWQEVDDNDDTYYRVTDAPLVDGNVEVDLMKKLWENPSPTASFNAQNITLNSADYDLLLWVFGYNASNPQVANTLVCKKGANLYASYPAYGNSQVYVRTRPITYVSDTSYSVGNAINQGSANNEFLIPVAIYGIKQKVSISLSAIISSVKATVDYSTDEHVIGTWIDGSTLYEKTISCGALPASNSQTLVPHRISNLKDVVSISGFATQSSTHSPILPLPYLADSSSLCGVIIIGENIRLKSATTAINSYDMSYVTLRYTKTS